MKKALMVIAIVLGLVCLYVAYVYFTTTANLLPSYFPGYIGPVPGIAPIHVKHGVAALVVAIALFVFAWFESGPKKV